MDDAMSDDLVLDTLVERFFCEEVATDLSLTRNTERSYRDSIRLFLSFLHDHLAIEPGRLAVAHVTRASVLGFVAHLEHHRGNSASTCNQRLKVIHALFRFIARQGPELAELADPILAIPLRRLAASTLDYLDKSEIEALLAVPDRRRAQGQRDYALLLFLYNTGARASEIAELTVGAISAQSVRFCGSGFGTRICPLWPQTSEVLRELLGARLTGALDAPVFQNVRGTSITRFGIHTLVARTAAKAAQALPSLQGKRVSPHTIRHTTAIHLLRAGVDAATIRGWLGQTLRQTTTRHAKLERANRVASAQIRHIEWCPLAARSHADAMSG
jgi:site-specific recombinase XerD